jgi:hypothetical protein
MDAKSREYLLPRAVNIYRMLCPCRLAYLRWNHRAALGISGLLHLPKVEVSMIPWLIKFNSEFRALENL